MRNNSRTKGYKIDFTNNVFTMNYTFKEKLNIVGSEEYLLFKTITTDFPNLRIVVESGRKQKSPKKNKRFTYSNMELYISTFENRDSLMKKFNSAKKRSKLEASPYKYVCDWFKKQFPNYTEVMAVEKNEAINIVA